MWGQFAMYPVSLNLVRMTIRVSFFRVPLFTVFEREIERKTTMFGILVYARMAIYPFRIRYVCGHLQFVAPIDPNDPSHFPQCPGGIPF